MRNHRGPRKVESAKLKETRMTAAEAKGEFACITAPAQPTHKESNYLRIIFSISNHINTKSSSIDNALQLHTRKMVRHRAHRPSGAPLLTKLVRMQQSNKAPVVTPKPYLASLTGKPVIVKLKWGMEYRGTHLRTRACGACCY